MRITFKQMKTVIMILLLLTANFVFGQRANTIFSIGATELQPFSRQDFIDNNLTKVSAYSYSINKKGKLQKDSLLLYRQQFDITQNKLYGLNSMSELHRPSFLTWYEFETYYNANGQVMKEVRKPKDIKTEYGSTEYNVVTFETEYEYDDQQREIKKTNKVIEHSYFTSKYTKDTFHLHIIKNPKIDEYVYNSDNQKIKRFHTVDSTRYLRTKSSNPDKDSNTVSCSYCHSRYLNVEWKYNADGKLTEWISYTMENLIHTKQYYFYDEQQRLIKQIDSTGWYLSTTEPYWKSTTTIQYSDTGRIVTKIDNTEKTVSYFDTNDKLVKECTFYNTGKNPCTQFVYDKNKLIREQTFFGNGSDGTTECYYNTKELLSEERTYRNGKLTAVIRYYYE